MRRLEELRRTASNSDLRSAYEAAIGSLDGVVYWLAMLRPLDAPKPAKHQAPASVAAPPARKTKAAAAPRQPLGSVLRASHGGEAPLSRAVAAIGHERVAPWTIRPMHNPTRGISTVRAGRPRGAPA